MVAGLCVSRMTLNLELLRNAPVAYLGKLSFLNVNGEEVAELLPESNQDGELYKNLQKRMEVVTSVKIKEINAPVF